MKEKERRRESKDRQKTTFQNIPLVKAFSQDVEGKKRSYLLVHTVVRGNTVLQQLPSA